MDIVHVRALFNPDRSDWMTRYRIKGATPCIEGTPGVEVLPFARERKAEKVFVKRTFDAFHDSELQSYLEASGKRFVLVAGLVTSVCVLLTTASTAQKGFLTAILSDCCADEVSAHENTLQNYPFIFDQANAGELADRYDEWCRQLLRLEEMTDT